MIEAQVKNLRLDAPRAGCSRLPLHDERRLLGDLLLELENGNAHEDH